MYVAILDVAADEGGHQTVCWGPFADELQFAAWWDLINMTLDLGIRNATRAAVCAPFDMTDSDAPADPDRAVTAQHILPDADDKAAGFVVRLTGPVVRLTGAEGRAFGTFPTRAAAVEWWDAQAPYAPGDTGVHVLPILEP